MFVLFALFSQSAYAQTADILARYVRQNRVTAGVASAASNLDISPTTPATPAPPTLRARWLIIKNENTLAGDDAYFNVESATAVATDAANGTNVRINAGETISFKTQVKQVSYIRTGANNVTLKFVSFY